MPPIPPDPDFRFADSDIAPIAAARGELSDSADAIRSMIPTISATNVGHGADLAVEQMHAQVENLNDAAGALWAEEKMHAACAAARDHFRTVTGDATVADTEAAYGRWQALRAQLMAADDHHAALYRRPTADAERRFNALWRQRETAVADFEAAEDAATDAFLAQIEKLRTTEGKERSGRGDATPGTPAAPTPRTVDPTAPAPEAHAPTPLPAPVAPAELPGATAPLATAPATALSAAGTGSSGLTPAQAAVLGAALSQQQGQSQQQPVQIPAPMPAPALTPPQQPRRAEDPFADYDPNAVLAGLARGDFRPTTATVAAPAITPLNPPPPTFTPLSLGSSLSGLVPVNPVVAQPVVTGTSTAGLITDNNVSGRPDGATARTATSPGPATNLSGASADQTTARPAATGAGTGMGGVPMMGPMMGGMNGMGGAGKDRDPVTAAMTPDQVRLLGLEAIGEAVPGGTIARKDDAA